MTIAPSPPHIDDSPVMTLSEPLEADAAQVRHWLDDGEAILVDVREVSEFENERIPGALLMPLSFFEAEAFPRIPGMKVVLHCAIGKRSAAAGKQLLKAGFSEAISLKGGLAAWKEAGYAIDI